MLATVVAVPAVTTNVPPIATKDGASSPANYSDIPIRTQCPQCRKAIMTQTTHSIGLGTWLIALVILLVFFPLCFLPFCINGLKDVRHTCPQCGAIVGVKKLLG